MKLEVFRAWCASKGIHSCLQIQQTTSGYRYTTLQTDNSPTRPIESSSSLPSSGMVNILSLPLNACLKESTSEGLADRLAFERSLGDLSDFQPYLDTLPTSVEEFQQLPRFWSGNRVSSVSDGGQLLQAMERDRPRWNPVLSDPWALACVDSRSHFLPDGRYCLSPLLDMINHDPTVKTDLSILLTDKENETKERILLNINNDGLPTATSTPATTMSLASLSTWWEQLTTSGTKSSSRSSTLGSKATISSTSQQRQIGEVCISYGELTNLQTLMNYGFVLPYNIYNQERITIRCIREPNPVTLIFPQSTGIAQDEGLGQLRRNLANREELEILSNLPDSESTRPLLFVSRRNEEEMFGLIGAELELAINEAKHGAEESVARDDQLVASYLYGRVMTLQVAFDCIAKEYPHVLS